MLNIVFEALAELEAEDTKKAQEHNFNMLIAARMAFGCRRKDLIENWLECFEGDNDTSYWAQKIQILNDAEIHFTGVKY